MTSLKIIMKDMKRAALRPFPGVSLGVFIEVPSDCYGLGDPRGESDYFRGNIKFILPLHAEGKFPLFSVNS